MAAMEAPSRVVQRGIKYLLRTECRAIRHHGAKKRFGKTEVLDSLNATRQQTEVRQDHSDANGEFFNIYDSECFRIIALHSILDMYPH